MIFGKKNNFSDEDTLRNETYERYKQSSVGYGADSSIEKVSEVRVKSSQETSVQWPNPRANQVSQEEIELQTIEEREIPQKTQGSSKLAQFVSNSLSNVGIKQSKPVEALRSIEPQQQTPLVNESFKAAINTAFAQTAPKLSFEDEIKRKYGTNIKSALGPGTIIEGTFSFETPVCIEGTLMGEIRSSSLLIVGPEASVQAKVKVGTLIVYGAVRGDVEATELVAVKENGLLEGNVLSEKFSIDEGGWFQGRCVPTAPEKVLEKYSRKQKESSTPIEEPSLTNKIEQEPVQQELNIQNEILSSHTSSQDSDDLLLPADESELSELEKWSL